MEEKFLTLPPSIKRLLYLAMSDENVNNNFEDISVLELFTEIRIEKG